MLRIRMTPPRHSWHQRRACVDKDEKPKSLLSPTGVLALRMAKKTPPRLSVVVPILNKGCTFPSTVPLPLSQNLTFQRIRGDDLAAITEKDDDASTFLKGGSFVLLFTNHDSEKTIEHLQDHIVAALFSLNIL